LICLGHDGFAVLDLTHLACLEDATAQKPAHEMTDDELHAVLWRQYRELGITEDEVAQAAVRREAEGRPAYVPPRRWAACRGFHRAMQALHNALSKVGRNAVRYKSRPNDEDAL
jgi:hypothetical protein